MKIRVKSLLISGLGLILCSCAGYKFKQRVNPFKENEIRVLAVPMFINYSNLPQLAGPLTNEIQLLLSQYPDLKIVSRMTNEVDAVLVGIIRSRKLKRETLEIQSRVFTEGSFDDSIGNRNQFFIGTSEKFEFRVQFSLVKKPSPAEIMVLRSKYGEQGLAGKNIVFNETLDFLGVFPKIVRETSSPDAGGIVNSTQSKGLYQQIVKETSIVAAKRFKDVVLDVF